MDASIIHLRVAFFLPSLQGGGAERVFVTLANSFAARGYTVDLIVGSSEGPYRRELSESVNLLDLKKPRVSLCLVALIRYLRQAKPYMMFSTMMHANIITLLAKKLSRSSTKIVVREAAPQNIQMAGR